MAGFLDKQSRVMDVVLTGLGKSLLAQGDLRFIYWKAFDDEVDYSPFISQSGSLSSSSLEDAISQQIEATPIREAVTGYRTVNRIGTDRTNVKNCLYDMPHGQNILPRTIIMSSSDSTIEVKQRKLVDAFVARDAQGKVITSIGPFDKGYDRFDSSQEKFSLKFSDFPGDYRPDGIILNVFESGSDGYQKIFPKRDINNELVFDADVLFSLESD